MKRALAKALLDIEAVKLRGTDNLFTWVSGIRSPIYCDNRLTISYPEIRKMIAKAITEKINSDYPNVDIIAATATAGIPHGAWIADLLDKPLIYVRGSNKKHGRKNKIEGYYENGKSVVLIEDLISTGKSSLEAVEALVECGLVVEKVYGIFNYNFDLMKEKFKSAGVVFETLIDYELMLKVAVEEDYLSETDEKLLQKWSKNPRMFTDL